MKLLNKFILFWSKKQIFAPAEKKIPSDIYSISDGYNDDVI